ncbi:patatin-like phospholipase family protein [Luteimonas marina]|uniref:Patatin-like phospholipase family protein n=1 Tax=Luteimonas marina TaxID=488485 RepID=A0A5C5TUE6_9GAMM|nr:patatin-like phospholipase family protein [Luteimonas marina]TWT17833.1 patatin-like phospholipase family protein [Luteimonas marina]
MSLFQRLKTWWRRRWSTRRGAAVVAASPPLPGPAPGVDAEPDAGDAARSPRPVPVASRRSTTTGNAPRRIRLALQGGGSHGAFTWGVLDGLLQRDDIGIDAISGTSAGALNAAVLATGWAQDGREGAREALQRFWRDIGNAGGSYLLPLQAPSFGPPFDLNAVPGYDWASRFLRTLSPYDYNPLNLNPLRDVLVRHVDEQALRDGPIRLFVTATAVRSGEPCVFSGAALGLDALLASACLPFLFQAVEIDGEAYWDGGYSGNPSIHPLVDPDADCDIVVVRLNPAHREGVPRRSTEIMDRINEITFNASLIGELRMIGQVGRLQRQVATDGVRGPEWRLHVIADDVDLATLPASSRLRTDPGFVERLHGFGLAAVARFLDAHGEAIGRYSSHEATA